MDIYTELKITIKHGTYNILDFADGLKLRGGWFEIS